MSKETRVRERVTVKMAKEFLDSRRENQRAISQRHLAELTDAILFGRWIPNGESIKFDVDGYMIDGQHRCAAGIKAGKTFISDIVYGLPKEAYYTIDQKGKRRSSSDVLRMNGETNTTTLAAALAYNIAYEKGFIIKSGKCLWVSHDAQQICNELACNPEMRASVQVGRKCYSVMSPGPLSFLHYRFAKKDAVLADSFFCQLETGENLTKTDPVLHIRKVLLEDKIQNKAKLPIGEKIAYIIKGWNISRNGKVANSKNSIKWLSGGLRPESFPVIK